jgi:hypothetical protein
VRLEAVGAPLITMACHCRGCQRMTGGAYSLSSLYPLDRLTVHGETVRGGMKAGPDHRFCENCMSWLFTKAEQLEGLANVRSTMFDDSPAQRPYVEMFRSEAVPGTATGAARSYDEFPQEDEFPKLIAEYAAWDERVRA